MADIPHDLELNQEDFSDVLPRLPDDLQDFDLFEGTLTCLTAIHCHDRYVNFIGLLSITKVSQRISH